MFKVIYESKLGWGGTFPIMFANEDDAATFAERAKYTNPSLTLTDVYLMDDDEVAHATADGWAVNGKDA